ncbi:MAG: aminoacyl-tRNA deacylase [Actinomycetota bacterium]
MKTSVDVHNFLLEREISHELVPTGDRYRSPDRIAAALGLPPEQVGGVVLFQGEEGPVAALVPAGTSAEPKRVARAAREQSVKPLSDDEVTDLTGFLPEAVPPVGLPRGTRVVMDRGLRRQEVLYFPGGEVTSVLKIRAADLARAADARVARITA